MATLRLTNLSSNVKENDLRLMFEVFGEVRSILLRGRDHGGYLKGTVTAIVEMETLVQAEGAQGSLDGHSIDGLCMHVSLDRSTGSSWEESLRKRRE